MRLKYFDNAKGILIICIILGHVFSACADYYGYEDNFFKFFSLFMIQCFFFISAYFSSVSKRKRSERIWKMVKLYLICQMIVTIYYSFVLKIMNFSFNIFYPRYTYWFLLTMISYLGLEYIFDKVSFKIMIPFSFGLSLAIGFVYFIGEFASLARTFTFLPFYVLGFYSKDLNLMDKLRSDKGKKILIIVSFLILLLSILCDDIFPYRLLRGKYSYYEVTGDLGSVFLKRIGFYVFSLIVSATFLKLMTNKETIFTKLGQNTLSVYLVQGAILKTFVTYGLLIDNVVLGNIVMLVVLIILIYIFDKLFNYLKIVIKERMSDINWIKNLQILKSH